MQGWNRRARESPGQVMEPDRTQLSQDQGGGTLAIDTLPDNGTRVVVSDVGAWMGREVLGWGAQVLHVHLSDTRITYLWGWPGGQCGERDLEGTEAGPNLRHQTLVSQSFIGCPSPCGPREVK